MDEYWADFRLQVVSIPVGSYLVGWVVDVRWDVCQDGCYHPVNLDSCPV